jgi:hypothetical protein
MGRLDLRDPHRDEDFCGPEFSDCSTAAHLRDCGFCKAVVLKWIDDVNQTGGSNDRARASSLYRDQEIPLPWHHSWKPSSA